jgi:hypothetical protein
MRTEAMSEHDAAPCKGCGNPERAHPMMVSEDVGCLRYEAPEAAPPRPILGPVRCVCDEPERPYRVVDGGMWGSLACNRCSRLLLDSPPFRASVAPSRESGATTNGSTLGHAPDVLPQGMTFHAGELGDAYLAGAREGFAFPRDAAAFDATLPRAVDAYVKLAHLRRMSEPR